MLIGIVFSLLIVSAILWKISPIFYGMYLIHKQNGFVPIYDIGDGYRMHGWPGYIYYPIPLKSDNDYRTSYKILVKDCISLWHNKDWYIGQAKTEDNELPAYFAVKIKHDLPIFDVAPDFLDRDKDKVDLFFNKYEHDVYFPVKSLEELSDIVGFDVSNIELSTVKPGALRPKGEFEDYEIK